jgi:hypothetical protein
MTGERLQQGNAAQNIFTDNNVKSSIWLTSERTRNANKRMILIA